MASHNACFCSNLSAVQREYKMSGQIFLKQQDDCNYTASGRGAGSASPQHKTAAETSVALPMRWLHSRNKVETAQEYVNCAAEFSLERVLMWSSSYGTWKMWILMPPHILLTSQGAWKHIRIHGGRRSIIAAPSSRLTSRGTRGDFDLFHSLWRAKLTEK